MNPTVNLYFDKAGKRQKERDQLQLIIHDCPLTEELKWGVPCYTFQKSNVVLIHAFKEYCAILFVKGTLLQDTDGILIAQTENNQASRQIRFTNVQKIVRMQPVLKACVYEAIEVKKAGLTVDVKKSINFAIPDEFQRKLAGNPALKTAFTDTRTAKSLSPSLCRPEASQNPGVEGRKCTQQILDGKGLSD